MSCSPRQPPETTSDEHGRQARAPAEQGDPSALLTTERVTPLFIELDPAAMAALAAEPRRYVKGSFRHRDQIYPEVAVRFKGHRTMRTWAEKPSFKINFSRHHKGRRFHGLKQLILDNMVEDPTMLRETLGFEIARALGVPAPRTGFVELFVNRQRFGLYTLVEPVDTTFLKAHFGNADGPLYEGEYGCDFYPGDVVSMELDSGDDDGRELIKQLAQRAADAQATLWSDDSPLDVAALQRFLALGALIGDFDGYRHAHNYRAYRDPRSGRWSLLPWGLDRVLKKGLAPFDSHGLLAKRCFADRACRLGYVQALSRAAERFDSLSLGRRLHELDGVVRAAVARDPRKPHSTRERREQLDRTRHFIKTRTTELRRELACWDGARELDRDADGHGCDDCDDTNALVHPGAGELCNGIDDNCSGLIDDAPNCPCETIELEGASFSLCALPMPWADAARFCEQRGGHLARILDKTQSRALYDAARAIDKTEWWIGLHDRQREGRPEWHDGSDASFTYWANGEPDDHACGQDCGALREGSRGKWRDMHCASPRPFICQDAVAQ